ncbi:MAG: hypothetical protein KAJ97_07860 [Acidobacteria bacterium]|nr:hypothetical protein [Acidobacteriota bacterium]
MAQGGGGAAGGAGGAVGGGGGGSKILDILKSIGIPVGLGVLASGSPLAAMGVRTGLGAYSMFSENRRQKKLSELMAEYYGGQAGEKVEAPSNAGDPAFGAATPGKFGLGGRDMAFKEGRDTPSPLGLGGGGRGLAETLDQPEPSMADSAFSPNKISELLSRKAAPAEKPAMGRDEFFARMAATGGMTPMQIESLKGREQDRATSTERYETGLETDRERYEDTIEFREGSEARSEESLGFSRRAADRADESLDLQKSAADRAVDREARITANSAADDARAERAAEMAEERFEMVKAQYEESKKLDVKEVASLLNAVNSTLGDMELQLKFADEGQKVALEEKTISFRAMQATLMSMLEQGVQGAQGGVPSPLLPSHDGAEAPVSRRRYNAATGTFD